MTITSLEIYHFGIQTTFDSYKDICKKIDQLEEE